MQLRGRGLLGAAAASPPGALSPGWVHAVPLRLGLWFVTTWTFPPQCIDTTLGLPLISLQHPDHAHHPLGP